MRLLFAFTLLLTLASCAPRYGPVVPPEEVRARFGFAPKVVEICGTPDILGEEIDPVGVNDRDPRCGFDDAVRVYAVGGVELSPPARMTCRTAEVTRRWVKSEMKRALRRDPRDVLRLHTVGDYSCRTRNNRPGARLSEHAKGTAVDIGAFTLTDGTRLSVLRDWRGPEGDVLKRLFRASCRAWSTAIGPDGDQFHQDHFHLDATRDYGPGTYCR